MRKRLIYHIFIFSGFFLYLNSCTPESCIEETNAYLKATFYSFDTRKIVPPDKLTIYGIGRDTSKIYDNDAKVQPAMIPLNPSSDTSTFIIEINSVSDTLKLIYTSFPHLISKECGYTFYHKLDTLFTTNNAIDSIYTGKKDITTINEENIRIYY